jgi:hypothetical protein
VRGSGRDHAALAQLVDLLGEVAAAADQLAGYAGYRASDIGDLVPKVGHVQGQLPLAARGAQIDPARLVGESSVQRRGQAGGARAIEITLEVIPFDLAVGSTSRATQGDAAASGEASRMKNSLSSNALMIDGHNPGLADKLTSSRNTRTARGRYHGLASWCKALCKAGANLPSTARLYDRNAAYRYRPVRPARPACESMTNPPRPGHRPVMVVRPHHFRRCTSVRPFSSPRR